MQIEQCGLFVHKQFQFIGTSPDGIVTCDCCGEGVLELKCPLCLVDDDDFSSLKYLKEDDLSSFKLVEEHIHTAIKYKHKCCVQVNRMAISSPGVPMESITRKEYF